jgi:histidinol phosphatase-like enzyme
LYFKFICISNQAGIALGLLNKLTLKKINKYIAKYFQNFGVDIVDFYISPDHYLSNSFYRKPNPGLFLKASKDYKFLVGVQWHAEYLNSSLDNNLFKSVIF